MSRDTSIKIHATKRAFVRVAGELQSRLRLAQPQLSIPLARKDSRIQPGFAAARNTLGVYNAQVIKDLTAGGQGSKFGSIRAV